MIQALKDVVVRLILAQKSPSKLALSFCLGVFIAFSPFIGFHTLMMLALAWIFHLNFAMVYVASHIVNNPLTMGPLYWLDHMIGKKFLYFMYGKIPANPAWMEWLNLKICYYTGLPGLSLWSFVIGGNILGLMVSILLYPMILWLFNRILNGQTVSSQTT